MPTLIEYFNNDFKDLSFDGELAVRFKKNNADNAEEVMKIKRRIRQEINSSVRFFTFYIPEFQNTLPVIISILDRLADHKKDADVLEVIGGSNGDIRVGLHKSLYSNRMYFYTETQLTNEEVAKLDEFCKEKLFFVTLRSNDYLKRKMEIEKPMAFISHDSRDKENIAKPLANGLSSRLCFVWYDEFSLSVGQSLRESIEKGIKEAKKCILVLTPHFLSNPGWTKKEFNSIFTREVIFNEKIVLPIWYNVKKEDVYDFSPSLADTVALMWPNQENYPEEDYKKEVQKIISKIHTAVTQ